MEQAELIFFSGLGVVGIGVYLLSILGIAGLDLVILASLLKTRRLVDVCLRIMFFAFIVALVYENQGRYSRLLFYGFVVLFFALPLLNFCYLLRVGRILTKPGKRNSFFESATIVALLPSCMGLLYTIVLCYTSR